MASAKTNEVWVSDGHRQIIEAVRQLPFLELKLFAKMTCNMFGPDNREFEEIPDDEIFRMSQALIGACDSIDDGGSVA